MNITIVGTGYVGLVTGTCFSEMGNSVTCVDLDLEKIENLKNGIIPIYEPGLKEMVIRNIKEKRLSFSTSLEKCIDKSNIIFSAVGTPPNDDGGADLHAVLEVARTFGKNISKYSILVTKSTVPVGTSQKVKKVIEEELSKRNLSIPFSVVSNPEFLKEGSAIDDFMKPDRVIIGSEDNKAKQIMQQLYRPFMLNGDRILFTSIPSAEMIKYTANSMLATRISFMNEIANLCEILGANVDDVRKGIGTDSRIGKKFLFPGCGYGGSCFPKDIKALIKTAHDCGYDMKILKSVEEVNNNQKKVLFKNLKSLLPNLNNKKIAIWGLSFKPNTDDMRESPSIVLINKLIEENCTISVYDPVAINEAKKVLNNTSIEYCENMYEALSNADALILVTEWKMFREPDWNCIKNLMKHKIIIDGRNIYNPQELLKIGFTYKRIG